MRLSEAQMAAALHLDGPALCIAGPGSGKTAVIVNRVGNLIRSGVLPEEILVVTFAKAAARNMEKRFFETMQPRSSGRPQVAAIPNLE